MSVGEDTVVFGLECQIYIIDCWICRVLYTHVSANRYIFPCVHSLSRTVTTVPGVVISRQFICPLPMRVIPWVRVGRSLLKSHASISLRSNFLMWAGRTALHEIALWGNAALVSLMLRYAQGWKEPWDHRVRVLYRKPELSEIMRCTMFLCMLLCWVS